MAPRGKEYTREYYRQNREVICARQKLARKKNNAKFREREKRKGIKVRLAALAAYGSKCACCAENRNEFLAIDHIGGGGNAHRRTFKTSIYNWLKTNNYPAGFRILCHNCNAATAYYGTCPHVKEQILSNSYPLQSGDRAPNYSGRDSSSEGDRRPDSTGRANPPGDNPAGQLDAPNSSPLFRDGYCAPNRFLMAPFPCIEMEGDTSGAGTTIYEPNIREFGDPYDPTAPMRVRQADNFNLDSDNDGYRN